MFSGYAWVPIQYVSLYGTKNTPYHMLSFKQCTVLVFAGKLMWLSVYFSTKRRSFDTALKEWGENKTKRVFMPLRKMFCSFTGGGF